MNRPSVAVLGATGALGAEIIARLPGHLPRAKVHAFASERSAGRQDEDGVEVQTLSAATLAHVAPQVIIVATPDAAELPPLGDAAVIDLRSAARRTLKPGDPLAVPGPVAGTIAQLVSALGAISPVNRISGTVLESASMAGRAALDELRDQTIALLSFRTPPVMALPRRLAFDLLPETEPTLSGHDSASERLTADELSALLSVPTRLSHVRLPMFIGLGLDLHLEFGQSVDLAAVHRALEQAPGVELRTEDAPNLADVLGEDEILVGRVRLDPTRPAALHLWAVVDNLGVTANRILEATKTALNVHNA